MKIQEQISLLPYNTFGIDMPAAAVAELTDVAGLPELLHSYPDLRILGGGSNVLLGAPVDTLVLLNRTKGIELLREDEQYVWVSVASGEVWHELVLYALGQGWFGIENMALIPGTVGAAPIQNIGAYGVEVKDVIDSVTFWHRQEACFYTLDNAQCRFGYRDSIFKQELKDLFFISSVTFRFAKQAQLHTTYGAITAELEAMGIKDPQPADVAEAVIRIRSSKLPNPKEIGNAGSFFKNPTVPLALYEALLEENPAMPSYKVSETMVKIPAGWLIEQCGWKGFREGDAGVHSKQALVLVNYGQASGDQLWQLSGRVVDAVQKRFGIELEREVQVWR
jgi:UDP-N-acetylmuramate dehydrogenase